MRSLMTGTGSLRVRLGWNKGQELSDMEATIKIWLAFHWGWFDTAGRKFYLQRKDSML